MCIRYIAEFWTAIDKANAGHERRVQRGIERPGFNPDAKKVEFWDHNGDFLARPVCQNTRDGGYWDNRIFNFCFDDEYCSERLEYFETQYDDCQRAFEAAERNRESQGMQRTRARQWREAYNEWISAYENHKDCPRRRDYDPHFLKLERDGVCVGMPTLEDYMRIGRNPHFATIPPEEGIERASSVRRPIGDHDLTHNTGVMRGNSLSLLPFYIEFWTPTDFKDGSLENLAKRGQLQEGDNPFARLRRIEYFECDNNPQQQVRYTKSPHCKDPIQGGRQGSIRAYCPGDDCCQVRISFFAKLFDEAMQQLENARRISPVNPAHQQQQAKEVQEFEQRAQQKLREWQFVWSEHLYCPQHKQADGMICMLIQAGVMERPVELWPDRRMGQDPRMARVR
ncbi:hypothetical protein Q7P37_009040 [Cladosporium fusiforme]